MIFLFILLHLLIYNEQLYSRVTTFSLIIALGEIKGRKYTLTRDLLKRTYKRNRMHQLLNMKISACSQIFYGYFKLSF